MGAKTWMLVYADGRASELLKYYPALDPEATTSLAKRLFPSATLEPIENGDLSQTCPRDDTIYIGCFPGVSIIAAKEFGIDYPSKLAPTFLEAAGKASVYLHAMHSVMDWFAYATWTDGELQRSLSLSPDSGILEDIGQRADFEKPYWSGQRPVFDGEAEGNSYPFPFHPLELGEAALLELFGYRIEGPVDSNQIEPERIPLLGFRRRKKRWKLW